ncbi:MAG: kelch repeat-containing protein [Planctomycetota bacterium]
MRTAMWPVLLLGLLVADGITAQQRWRPRSMRPRPSHHKMVFDTARSRLVLVTGTATSCNPLPTPFVQTWEWDGLDWSLRRVTNGPAVRFEHSVAYDMRRGRLVMFGGHDGSGARFGDTWEWDGARWARQRPNNAPTPRSGAAMAYDAARGRVVLFGGRVDWSTALRDTWEWDGDDWRQIFAEVAPQRRSRHAMVYDANRQRVVLFGGARGGSQAPLGDTWEWDGTDWRSRGVAVNPPARHEHALVYDPTRGVTLLFGGGRPGQAYADTWEWDGNHWTQRSPPQQPSARQLHAMAFDGGRGRVVLFGGAFGGQLLEDTWEWDGLTWRQDAGTPPPPPRTFAAMVEDGPGSILMFGGFRTGGALGDGWSWDGVRWRPTSPSVRPLPRGAAALAKSVSGSGALLFGGAERDGFGALVLGDTWSWSGAAWTNLRPTVAPPPRARHAMVLDPARGRIVLFGGLGAAGNVRADTWEWDGSAWTRITPMNSPVARAGHALAYDARRRRVVLFGGDTVPLGLGGVLSDTWEWDGVDWVELQPAASPPARGGHAMVFDDLRQRVVVYGGAASSFLPLGDTWEWDGTTWTQGTFVLAPSGREGAAMAYDQSRQQSLLFGGLCGNTWSHGQMVLAAAENSGAGCAGGAATPATLTWFGLPELGNGSFAVDVVGAAPTVPMAFTWSAGRGSVPFAGCTLWLDPTQLLAVPAQTNGGGFASFPAPMPETAGLSGALFYAQAVLLDTAAPSGLALSNGLRFSVGY